MATPTGEKAWLLPRQVAPASICPRAAWVVVVAPAKLTPQFPSEALLSEAGATNPTSTPIFKALGPVLPAKASAEVKAVTPVAVSESGLIAR